MICRKMQVLSTSMHLFLVFCSISVVFAMKVKEKEKKCDGLEINGVIHEEKVLINGVNRPYQLSYYKKNNTDHVLFFSYNIGHQDESTFEIGYSEGGFPVPVPISKVKNGFATAINQDDDLIYFGGSEGIYVRNLTGSYDTELLIPGHDIWDLFYKDSLYFINYPSRRLYKHHSGHNFEKQTHIHEKLYHFVIDGDGDTFISNKSGLFMIKKDSAHRIHFAGPRVFRAFEVNRKGVAHFCGQNEVYIADKEKKKLHEIAKIKNIFGLTFDDDDNMIFSDPHQVVKLEPKKCEKK